MGAECLNQGGAALYPCAGQEEHECELHEQQARVAGHVARDGTDVAEVPQNERDHQGAAGHAEGEALAAVPAADGDGAH